MAEESDLEKTEPASQRRLEQAREEGQVPSSRELATFLVTMTGVAGMYAMAGWMWPRSAQLLRDRRLNHQVEVISGVLAEECGQLLTEFFREKLG